jgi:hypothetical protein
MAVRFLVAALLLLALPARAATGPASAFQVGINLDGVTDYAAESSFVDAIKHSRHWGTAATPWDEAAAVDAKGWPTQDAGLVVLCCITDANGHSVIAGTYALSFTGQANVSLTVGGVGTVTGQAYDSATNITTATVTVNDSGDGVIIALSFTNTQRLPTDAVGTGVTDVHLIRPRTAPNGASWWHETNQVFTDPFLKLLAQFPAIRTMNWENTNGNTVSSWAGRTPPTYATQQTPKGVAWEYVIELANTLKKDLWINVPVEANQAYIQNLAELMHAKLNPTLHLYIEYSNEVWNYSFAQAGWNQAAAEAEVAANPKSPLAWQCSTYADCQYVWGERRVGAQIVAIAKTFQKVFGAHANMLRPIYATQLGQTYFLSLVLPMIQHFWGPPANYLYGVAQAPYWTGDNTLDNLTAAQELSNAAANLATLNVPEQGFATWSRYYGLQSVTYEGGPGMNGTPSLDAKIAANRSTDIGSQVTQAITGAASEGISLYMYYDDAGIYGQYGMWGATEDVFDLQTPKMTALQGLIANGSTPLQGGVLLPTSFPAMSPDLSFGSNYITSNGSYAYLGQGGTFGYLVDVPAAGTYTVILTVGTYYGATKAALKIDQALVGTAQIPSTGNNVQNWTPTKPVKVKLPAGLHVLTISAPTGQFGMTAIQVQTAP